MSPPPAPMVAPPLAMAPMVVVHRNSSLVIQLMAWSTTLSCNRYT